MDVPKFRPQLTARETQERKEAVPVNISLNYTELIEGLRDDWLKTVDDHFQFLHEYHVTMARQRNKRNRFTEHQEDHQDETAGAVFENVEVNSAASGASGNVSDFRQDMELYRRLFQRFLILDARRTQTLLLLQKQASLQTLRMQFQRQWPDHQDVRRFFSELESELDDSWAVFDNEKVGIVGAEVLMAGKFNSKRSADEDERDEVLANEEGVDDELVEGEELAEYEEVDEELYDKLDEESAQELGDEVDKELDEEFDEDLPQDDELDEELFHDEDLATAQACVAAEARRLFEEVKKLQTLFSRKGTRLDTNLFLAGDSDEDFQGLLEEHKRLAEPHMFGTAGRSRRVCRKRERKVCGNNSSNNSSSNSSQQRPDLQTDLAYSSGSDMTTPSQPRIRKLAPSHEDPLMSPAKRMMRQTSQTTVPCQTVLRRRQSSATSFLVSRPRLMSDDLVEDAFSITLCENTHAQPGLVREEDQDQSSHISPDLLPSEVASSTESSLTEEDEASQFHCEDPIQSETSFATSINSFGESPSMVKNSFATPINSFGESPSVVTNSFATIPSNSFEMSPSVVTSTPLRAARKSMMGTTGDDSGYCC